MRFNLEQINKLLKVNIDKELLISYIVEAEHQQNLYGTVAKQITGIENITKDTLKNKYKVATYKDIDDERLVRILGMYFSYKDFLGTCNSVLEMINNGTLKPELYLSTKGNITCKNHAFNYIKNPKFAKLLGYQDYIKFKTVEELENFILKYFKLFRKYDNKSTYFIRSNTLFFTLDLQSYKIAYFNSNNRKEYIQTCSKFTDELYKLSMEFLADANIVANKESTFYNKFYDRFVDFALGLQAQIYEGTPEFKEFYKLINAKFMEDETDKANKFELIKISYIYNNQNIRFE